MKIFAKFTQLPSWNVQSWHRVYALVEEYRTKLNPLLMENDFNDLSAKMAVVNNLYNIIMQSPSAITITKGKDHLLWLANATTFKLIGAGVDVLGKPLAEAVPGVIDTGVVETFDRVYTTGAPAYGSDVPVTLAPNGVQERHYFDIYYQPYYEEGNTKPAGVFTISHDVTEAVEARKKVGEVEERLRSALQAAEMGTWDHDLITNTIIASDGLKRLFGLSDEQEFNYETFINAVCDEDRQYTRQAILDVITLKDRRDDYDLTYRIRKGGIGQLRWIRAKGKVYANAEGIPARFIGTLLDVTNEKSAEQRSKYIFETVPLSIWEKDYSDMVIVLDNLKLLYGKRLKDYLLNNIEEVRRLVSLIKINDTNRASLKMFEAETKEELIESMSKVFSDEYLPVFVDELMAVANKDKTYAANCIMATLKRKKIICSTTIDFPADGNYKNVIVSRYDISELVRANENLQRFIHMISHDLKEPIRKIAMYVSRLQEELNDKLTETSNEYFDRINTGTKRMFSMIDGVLTFSKVGAMEEQLEEVDLNEVIRKVQEDLELLIRQKSATIRYADLPILEATPLMLHQVFSNLINNSLKFSRIGVAPIVTISCDTVVRNGQTYARMVLEDNGIGFEQKYAEDVFQSFTRLHAKDKYEGVGLGLFLSRLIIERLNGSITVQSEQDKGTVFEIFLPVKR